MESFVVEPLFDDTFVVESFLWSLCCGALCCVIFVVGAFAVSSVVVESLLLNNCC